MSSSLSIQKAMETMSEDRGHRLGNFHNYYSFHPSQHRLDVLQSRGILDFVLRTTWSASEKDVERHAEEERSGFEKEHAKRLKTNDDGDLEKFHISNKTMSKENVFTYCDLGCNEGVLTLEVARALLERNNGRRNTKIKCLGLDVDSELIARAANNNKQHPSIHHTPATAEFEEVDLNGAHKNGNHHVVEAQFQVCNLCDAKQHLELCHSFLSKADSTPRESNETNSLLLCRSTPTDDGNAERRENIRFHLTSVFSTTMWIHIHSGDDGLTEFLKRTCEMTSFLLLEPQPSKCYRNVNVRLRKMNLAQIDASSERLKMRVSIEKEIERVVCQCGFRRIHLKEVAIHYQISKHDGTEIVLAKDSAQDALDDTENVATSSMKTVWERSLQLYARIES